MKTNVVGWDIGGAHVKAALLDSNGNVREVFQRPCPLWKDLSFLHKTIAEIISQINISDAAHALTMTGELADLFSSRLEGVNELLKAICEHIPDKSLYVFAGTRGLIPFGQINTSDYTLIASANWLASAVYTADWIKSGLFVDIGSTTTDIILIENSTVKPIAYTDFDRLQSGELVYTGIVRTPVYAIANQASVDGLVVPMMAEQFATAADIYRLSGDLPDSADQWPASDGGAKTVTGSARRLARMVGRDLESAPLSQWHQLAKSLQEHQLTNIQNAMNRQLSRLPENDVCLIGAGIGRFLVDKLSRRFGYQYIDFSNLVCNTSPLTASADCAPAVAIAKLLHNDQP